MPAPANPEEELYPWDLEDLEEREPDWGEIQELREVGICWPVSHKEGMDR